MLQLFLCNLQLIVSLATLVTRELAVLMNLFITDECVLNVVTRYWRVGILTRPYWPFVQQLARVERTIKVDHRAQKLFDLNLFLEVQLLDLALNRLSQV